MSEKPLSEGLQKGGGVGQTPEQPKPQIRPPAQRPQQSSAPHSQGTQNSSAPRR
jgi:hypothetical protein